MSGKYIVIDGIDGGGKGSLFQILMKEFPPVGNDQMQFVYTREPGGTDVGEKLRNIIVNDVIFPISEFFLLLAQRKEVRGQVIEPAIASGLTVISDRSDSSTFAYQIKGRNLVSLESIFWEFRKLLTPLPSLYIFLDLDPVIASQRRSGRQKPDDRFDAEDILFFSRVRNGFIEFARKIETESVFVDASQSKEAVTFEVIAHIRKHIDA